MEIVPKNQVSVIDAYMNQVQIKQKPEEDAEKAARQQGVKADTVIISEGAKRVQEAQSQLRSIPDVRADKVAEIKRQIEDGTYEIKADAIAEKMIRGSLINDWFI
jgi:negative regulator of flagellin synthesis FlgM